MNAALEHYKAGTWKRDNALPTCGLQRVPQAGQE